MELSSRYLIGAVIGACGGCAAALTPAAADAQTNNSNPVVPLSATQSPYQPNPSENILARMSLRMTELENEIRRLTGENEELTYRLGQLEESVRKSASDTELRLKTLESGAAPAAPGTANRASAGAKTAPDANLTPTMAGKRPVSGADKGAKVLGTLRVPDPGSGRTAVAGVGRPPVVIPQETPEQQYNRAHSLIVKQRKYGEAERVLRNFIQAHPNHALTSNAHYWLGRTYFVRADYENAAFAFAEGFQKFPNAEKAPANLLNLGMSLARLGKNREACTTYTRLLRTYKNVGDSIKRRITRERRRAKCRGS